MPLWKYKKAAKLQERAPRGSLSPIAVAKACVCNCVSSILCHLHPLLCVDLRRHCPRDWFREVELITSDVSDADMHNDADNHTDVDSYEVPMVPLGTVPFASPTTNTVAFASNPPTNYDGNSNFSCAVPMVPLESVPCAPPTTNTVVLAYDPPTDSSDLNSTGEFARLEADDHQMTAECHLSFCSFFVLLCTFACTFLGKCVKGRIHSAAQGYTNPTSSIGLCHGS